MGRILVVNSDVDTMSLLQTWLERKNHEVIYTAHVEQVPQIVKKFNPDVVLVDVMQGTVAEKLKTDEETREIPIVLMTGHTLPKKTPVIDKADDVIEKPFNLSLLEQKINRFISG